MSLRNRPYRAVIFDLDGVICFTDEYHYQAWKQIADREGIYFDRRINDRLRGVSRMESLEILLEKAGRVYSTRDKEEMAEEKNEIYRTLLRQMTPADVSEQTYETLLRLRKEKFALAIGSSSKNTPLILQRLGLVQFFDVISDGNGLRRSKPDPEVFLRAAVGLSLTPRSCLVVEDAQAGIQAAAAGGFDSAALGDACNSPLATYRMKHFSDLIRICLPAGPETIV